MASIAFALCFKYHQTKKKVYYHTVYHFFCSLGAIRSDKANTLTPESDHHPISP